MRTHRVTYLELDLRNEALNEESGSNEPDFEIEDSIEELAGDPASVCCDPDATQVISREQAFEDPTEIIDADSLAEDPTQVMDSLDAAEATRVLYNTEPVADANDSVMDGLDVMTSEAVAEDIPVMSFDDPAADSAEDDEEEKPRHHYLRNTLITLFVLIILCAAGACGWLYWDDTENASCHVPAGVTLAGVDVHGYSESELTSFVNKKVSGGSMGTTELKVEDKSYNFSMAQYATFDVSGTVEAVMATIEPDMATRCIERAKGIIGIADPVQQQDFDILFSVNKKKIKSRVQTIADQVDTEAQDASYGFDQQKRKVTCTKSKTGYDLNVQKTVKALVAAAQKGESTVDAVAEVTQPKVAKLGQAIYVDLNECHLYFYVNGKVKKDYPCTPGKSGYETPSGTWYLEYKDSAPTWYNPHSDWSKSMPETIAPGESNPLGLRALALSCGGGIYIHGTTNTGELGTHASHGCIRLANASVVELFDLVETGIPIFVY